MIFAPRKDDAPSWSRAGALSYEQNESGSQATSWFYTARGFARSRDLSVTQTSESTLFSSVSRTEAQALNEVSEGLRA